MEWNLVGGTGVLPLKSRNKNGGVPPKGLYFCRALLSTWLSQLQRQVCCWPGWLADSIQRSLASSELFVLIVRPIARGPPRCRNGPRFFKRLGAGGGCPVRSLRPPHPPPPPLNDHIHCGGCRPCSIARAANAPNGLRQKEDAICRESKKPAACTSEPLQPVDKVGPGAVFDETRRSIRNDNPPAQAAQTASQYMEQFTR